MKNRDLVLELENSRSNKMLKNVDIMIAENFKASVADLLKKMYWLRNLTEVAIEGEPLKVLLNRTHGADEDVHLLMSKWSK